jgi:predicted DNA-binding transcriptional regulator AlpA
MPTETSGTTEGAFYRLSVGFSTVRQQTPMGISRSTWQKLVAQRQTPPIVRIGAVQRIRRDAFEAWLGQHENSPNTRPK